MSPVVNPRRNVCKRLPSPNRRRACMRIADAINARLLFGAKSCYRKCRSIFKAAKATPAAVHPTRAPSRQAIDKNRTSPSLVVLGDIVDTA